MMSNQRSNRNNPNNRPKQNSKSGSSNNKRPNSTPRPNMNAAQKSRDEVRREQALRRKKKKRKKQLMVYGFSVILLIAISIILSLTVFFRINEITVEGNSIYNKKDIISASGIQLQDNLILSSKEKIEQNITKKLPYIGNVKISRKLPSTIVLKVEATSAKSAIRNGNGYILINEEGKVLNTNSALTTEKNLMIVNGCVVKSAVTGEKIKFNGNRYELITKVLKSINKNSIKKISQIDATDELNITMLYDNRITVIIGSTSEIDNKLALASEVLKKQDKLSPYEKGKLDLTISKKAYYTPESAKTTAAATATTAAAVTTTSAAAVTTTRSSTATTTKVKA